MLLEAGYLEQAIERLEDAIAINPNVRSARWEIARAYALEGRWDDNARLIAEAAGFWDDIPTAIERIEFSIGEGLFDLHWLDCCPLLDKVRLSPAFPPLRAKIKQRADAILDALYGDHHIGTSETAMASGL